MKQNHLLPNSSLQLKQPFIHTEYGLKTLKVYKQNVAPSSFGIGSKIFFKYAKIHWPESFSIFYEKESWTHNLCRHYKRKKKQTNIISKVWNNDWQKTVNFRYCVHCVVGELGFVSSISHSEPMLMLLQGHCLILYCKM